MGRSHGNNVEGDKEICYFNGRDCAQTYYFMQIKMYYEIFNGKLQEFSPAETMCNCKAIGKGQKYNYKSSVAILPFNLIVTWSLAMGEERFEVLE